MHLVQGKRQKVFVQQQLELWNLHHPPRSWKLAKLLTKRGRFFCGCVSKFVTCCACRR
jgi:hypothetical protein